MSEDPVWCTTCERLHGPMDWGDGCVDIREVLKSGALTILAPESMAHHTTRREVASGVWKVARPPRDTSWWRRWRRERRCQRETGHCWHPEGLIDWWCCMCSGEVDGMPPQRCVYCLAAQGAKT